MFEETGDEAEVAGLDAVHPRHQRQRQARRLRRAQPAGRSREGQAHRRSPLRASPSSPADGSVWGTVLGYPGRRRARRVRARIRPTPRSPRSTSRRCPGYGPRGGDIDRNGVVWASLASGHLASFDRRKCKGRSTGRPRPASIAPRAGRSIACPDRSSKDVTDAGSAEASYYTWVDQFDTFGLGKNVPIATGNLNELAARAGRRQVRQPARALSDGLLRQMDGRPHRRSERRLEGPGRCGRPTATRTMFHLEGGKENRPKVVKFQLRPDPLAR